MVASRSTLLATRITGTSSEARTLVIRFRYSTASLKLCLKGKSCLEIYQGLITKRHDRKLITLLDWFLEKSAIRYRRSREHCTATVLYVCLSRQISTIWQEDCLVFQYCLVRFGRLASWTFFLTFCVIPFRFTNWQAQGQPNSQSKVQAPKTDRGIWPLG